MRSFSRRKPEHLGNAANVDQIVEVNQSSQPAWSRHKLTLSPSEPVSLRGVTSERLGHDSTALTLNQYANVIPGMQADAAQYIANIVHGVESGGVECHTDQLASMEHAESREEDGR